jgi:hypothetical protein
MGFQDDVLTDFHLVAILGVAETGEARDALGVLPVACTMGACVTVPLFLCQNGLTVFTFCSTVAIEGVEGWSPGAPSLDAALAAELDTLSLDGVEGWSSCSTVSVVPAPAELDTLSS